MVADGACGLKVTVGRRAAKVTLGLRASKVTVINWASNGADGETEDDGLRLGDSLIDGLSE